jgi:glycosyltransferase involved in cell wall biosynthesis
MQKILIVSPKIISSQGFDGAQKRIFDIAKFLSKKNKIDFVCISNNVLKKRGNLSFLNKIAVFQISFVSRIFNTIICILKLQPMQKGFFFSKKMCDFILENKGNYDTIIFHLIRSAQYLPNEFRGKKILEMTDLGSCNYDQIIKKISFINPLKYLYFLEKILLRRYEKKVSNFFDKVVFISDKELSIAKTIIEKNKIINIGNTVSVKKKIFRHKKKNYKILFVGNINYLPNKLACYDFSKNILPKLNEHLPNLEFNIVGKINIFDKFCLSLFTNVVVHGSVNKLDKLIKNSVCGICNLKTATGIQNKIFTYMSYGLPALVSKNSFPKSLVENKEAIVYKNDNQLIHYILKLVNNKKISNKISKNSFKSIKKKFTLLKIYTKYQNIIKQI